MTTDQEAGGSNPFGRFKNKEGFMKTYSNFFEERQNVYFNSASAGIPTKNSIIKVKEYLDSISKNADITLDYYFSTIEECRKEVATLLNCSITNIGFVQNTTASVSLIKNSFPEIKKMIIFGKGFPCTFVPFEKDDRYSVEIISKNLENLDRELSKYKKTIVFVDLVDYLTGELTDISTLCDLIHDRGSIIAVDAIQGCGSVKIDLKESQVDFLFAGASKWLLGPQGIGFIYINRDHIERVIKRNAGWLSLNYKSFDSFENLPEIRFDASGVEGGTRNFIGILMMRENLKFLNSITIEEVQSHNIEGIKILSEMLEEHGNLTQEKSLIKSSITSFKTKKIKEFYSYLTKNNVKVSYRNDMVRFAFHIFNDLSDIDKFSVILKKFSF